MGVYVNQMKMVMKCIWDSVPHLSKLSEITVLTTTLELPKEAKLS